MTYFECFHLPSGDVNVTVMVRLEKEGGECLFYVSYSLVALGAAIGGGVVS